MHIYHLLEIPGNRFGRKIVFSVIKYFSCANIPGLQETTSTGCLKLADVALQMTTPPTAYRDYIKSLKLSKNRLLGKVVQVLLKM